MANFTAGTSFSDGVTNDVTAAKLNALVADAVPTSNLSLNSTTGTIATFNSTTPTFLGAITASTNTINIGSGQIFKDASGNVGVGTASPAAKIDVYGDGFFQNLELGRAGQTGNRNALIDFRGDDTYTDYGFRIIRGNTGANADTLLTARGIGNVVLQSEEAGQVLLATSGVARLTASSTGIAVGGNVNVKTSVPKATTAVTNTINLSSSDASNALTLELALGTNSTAASRYSSIQSVESGVAYRDLLLNKDGGNVGIGTTSPVSKLHVASGNITISNDYGIGAGDGSQGIYNGTNNTIRFDTASTERLRIDSSGGVTIAGLAGSGSRAVNASAAGLLSAASDASLKEEVVGASIAGLNEILQIHPKMYRWKDDIANRGDEASVELGFIANDVAPIIPSAAPMGNDGLYGFYDRSITAALVKAIQELKAKNDSLEARLEALEAK